MIYALHEALRLLVYEERLENRFERHRANAALLWEGLEAMGIRLHVPPAHRLHTLTTALIPKGVGDAAIRRLLDEYNIEIAGGLRDLKGRVWRIVLLLLAAFC